MKKGVAVVVLLSVLFVSLIATAADAQLATTSQKREAVAAATAADANTDIRETVVKRAEAVKTFAGRAVSKELASQKREELLKKGALQKLQESEKAKLRSLSAEKVERLAQLDETQLRKMKELSQERLRVIASTKPELFTMVAGLEKADIQKVAALDRQRLKQMEGLSTAEMKLKLARLKVIKADEDFKVRPIATEKLRVLAANFAKLEDNESKAIVDYKGRLEKAHETRNRLKSCGSNESASNDSAADCAAIVAEAIERVKEAALKAADRLVLHLQKVREKIESSESMTEEEVNAKTARIDELIAEVEAIKQKIEAATTKSQLNDAIKELRKLLHKVKQRSEAYSQGLLRAEIHGVIQRTEVIEKKLDCALSGLEANGTVTEELDEKIADFSAKMGSAREKLKAAKDLLESENSTQIGEAKRLIREARDLVQEAHRMLQEIRKEIRELGGQPCQEKQELVIEEEPEEVPTTNSTAINATG